MGESVQQPWLYYDHNVLGAINLVEVMRKHNVKNVSLHTTPSTLPDTVPDLRGLQALQRATSACCL